MKNNLLKSQTSSISFTRGQILLAGLTLVVLVALTIFTFSASHVSAKQSVILNVAQNSTPLIIDVQHDALYYVVTVESWLRGNESSGDVQSARDLLTKSLGNLNSVGISMSGLVNPEFFRALNTTDAAIQNSPSGLLPLQLRERTKTTIAPEIRQVSHYSKELVVSYQRSIEVKLRAVTAARESFTAKILVIRYTFLIMLLILIFWISLTLTAQYKFTQKSIKTQLDDLDLSKAELGVALLAISELRVLDDEKNEFISNINHELRTPLTSIIGYLGLVSGITDEESSPRTAKYLKIVDRNLILLLDLVENMLTISKLDTEATAQGYTRINLDEVIADTIFVLQPSLDAAEISIEFVANNTYDNFHDDWSINGNKGQISQVFINLIGNSIKFSPRASKMHVGISNVFDETGAKFVRASISDQGMGIPAQDLEKLFDRFFRSENALKDQIPGTGLGLAIVKKIVEQHGGRINIESEMNIGTVVHIELPIFVSKTDQLVLERRLPVLEKAIAAVTNAPLDQLQAVAHEAGGSISFYTFESEGEKLVEFSHWLEASPHLTESEILAKRNEILVSLKLSLLKIELGVSN